MLILKIGLDHYSQFAPDKLCNDGGSHRKDRHPKEDDEVANDEKGEIDPTVDGTMKEEIEWEIDEC